MRTLVRHATATLSALLLVLWPLLCNAQDTMQVTALRLDGSAVQKLEGVSMIRQGETAIQPRVLSVGDALAENTELTVPARSRVELQSRHGNRISLSAGARFRVGKVNEKGENHKLQDGEAQFSVKKALDFYQVGYKKFLATVRGTEYRIKVNEGTSVGFAVSEGAVEVERSGTVFIADGEKSREAQGIAETELVRAGQTKDYSLSVSAYLRTFETFASAEDYYRAALAEAEKSGDLRAIERAKANLGIILARFSRYAEALPLFDAALADARKRLGAGDHSRIAVLISMKASAHTGLSEYAKARALSDEALQMQARANGGKPEFLDAALLNSRGAIELYANDIDSAFDYLTRAAKVLDGLPKDEAAELKAGVTSNLGLIHFRRSEFKPALENFETAYAVLVESQRNRLSDEAVGLLTNLGMSAARASEHVKAIRYTEQALEMARNLYGGKDQESVAKLLNNLGTFYDQTSNFPKAADYYGQFRDMLNRLFGNKDHSLKVIALNGLALTQMRMSRFEDATKNFELAIAMEKRLVPDTVSDTIALMQANLGNIYLSTGQLNKAVEVLEEADVALDKKFKGMPDTTRIVVLSNLSSALLNIGQAKKAMENAERAVTMGKAIYGDKDNLQIAQSLFTIGQGQLATGNAPKAREVLQQSTEMLRRIYAGKDNVSLAQALFLLGNATVVMGSQREAITPFQDAVAMLRRLIGNGDNPMVAIGLIQIGLANSSTGDSDKALASLDEGLAMQKRLLGGKDNLQIAQGMTQAAAAYLQLQETDRAAATFREAFEMQARLKTPEHAPPFLMTTSMLASSLSSTGKIAEARILADRSLDNLSKLEASTLAGPYARAMAASVYQSAAQYDIALRMINEALRGMVRASGGEQNDTVIEFTVMRAGILAGLDQFSDAEDAISRANQIANRLHANIDHPAKVGIRMASAALRAEQGQPGQARAMLDDAMAMQSRLRGDRPHPGLVQSWLMRASLAKAADRFDDATAALRKAEQIAAGLNGSEKRRVEASVKQGWGELHLAQGKPVEAIPSFEARLWYLRDFYKDIPHPNVAEALNQLAIALARAGRADEAAKLIPESRNILAKVFPGGDHSRFAHLLFAEAAVLRAQGQHAEAVKRMAQSLDIREKRLGKEPNPNSLETLLLLADSASQAGSPAGATYLVRAKAMRETWLARQ